MSVPVEKSLSDVRNEIYSKLQEQQEADNLPRKLNLNRGPIRGLIELFAWGIYQLYLFLQLVLKQAFPSLATGSWLDLHSAQVGIERKGATKAQGIVTLTRSGLGNIPIPAGRIFKTQVDAFGNVYRFISTAAVVLQSGSGSVSVPVVAEEYGRSGNVVAGQISEIVTPINGIAGVTNASDWLTAEGRDRETDDELRLRYFLAWKDKNGVTKYAYESWALGVSGVESVRIRDQHPRGQGTVDVIVKGVGGLPTLATLNAVSAVIGANKPINDDVIVLAPSIVHVDINVSLFLETGDKAVIKADAEAAVYSYFQNNTIGKSFTRERLISLVMLADVVDVDIASPSADITAAADDLLILNSLQVTVDYV